MKPLHVESNGDGPVVLLAHGFTQTADLWGPMGDRLARRFTLVRPDLPGHARSSDIETDLVDGAELLVDSAPDGAFDLCGYSLGARFALHAALAHPERVRRLILIGSTAGIEDDRARQRRRRRDDALADELEASGDVEGFIRRWLAAPMFAGLANAGVAERLANTAPGLASSLRLAGTGTQVPLWDRLGELEMPVLVLAGADDPRFGATALRLSSGTPRGFFSLIPGAGHAAHLAQPALTARILERFLSGDANG